MSLFGSFRAVNTRVGKRTRIVAGLIGLSLVGGLLYPAIASAISNPNPLAVMKLRSYPATYAWTGANFPSFTTPSSDQQVVAFVTGLNAPNESAAAILRYTSASDLLRAKVDSASVALEDGQGVLKTVARTDTATSGTIDASVVGNTVSVKWNGVEALSYALTQSRTGKGCGLQVWQDIANSVSVGGVCIGIVGGTASPTTLPPVTSTTAKPATTTTVNAGTPSAVGSLTLDAVTNDTMRVAWTAPASQGASAVTSYVVGWTEGGTGRKWDSGTPGFGGYTLASSPVTLTNLLPGTSYSVRVTPVNSVGTGITATKTLSTAGGVSTTSATTPVVPTPTTSIPTSTGGALPSKLVGGYWQMWQGPNVSEITASAPQYNLQYAAFALGTGGNNGTVVFNPVFQSAASFKTDMAASKAKGSTWLLSIGGGSETGLRLQNSTHVDQLVNSIIPIIDNYGFQGIDWDLEGGEGQWTIDAMKSASLKLKAHYGSKFVISAAPRPYEDIYRNWAVAMGSSLDLFGFQFYDFPETKDTAFLTSYVDYRIDQAISMGIPASKIMIGAITYTQYNLGWNSVNVYRDIWNQQEAKHPDLRGMYIWETSLDKKENWSFAKTIGPAVQG